KDSSIRVRSRALKLIREARIREVALPRERDGDWDQTGWTAGITDEPLRKHKQGKRIQEQHAVPVLSKIEQLRTLLGIRSPQQLGYFLLASDRNDGPYTTFTIPKRDGSER